MRWVDAMDAVLDALATDPTLAAITGFKLLRRGEFTEAYVPSISWQIISDTRAENTAPFDVQLDVFARGLDQALTIEGRIWALLDKDTPQTLGGILMRTQITDARDHADPEAGVVHRSLDLELEPAREAYT